MPIPDNSEESPALAFPANIDSAAEPCPTLTIQELLQLLAKPGEARSDDQTP
jgi:hypothetical protein